MSDNLFDQAAGFHITDLANVRGVGIPEGERIRKIEAASDHDLVILRDECLTQGSDDTRNLVEAEQKNRASSPPIKKTWWRENWKWVIGIIVSIVGVLAKLLLGG